MGRMDRKKKKDREVEEEKERDRERNSRRFHPKSMLKINYNPLIVEIYDFIKFFLQSSELLLGFTGIL